MRLLKIPSTLLYFFIFWCDIAGKKMAIPTFELNMTLTPISSFGDFNMHAKHSLHVYFSKHIVRDNVFFVKKFEISRSQIHVVLSVPCRHSVDVLLGMVCMVIMTPNQTSHPRGDWRYCVDDHTANAFVSINELELIKTGKKSPKIMFYDTTSSDNSNKNKLSCNITVHELQFKWDNGTVERIKNFRSTEEALEAVRKVMNEYIQKYYDTIGLGQKTKTIDYKKPFKSHLVQMHVPVYYSLVNMPACTFALRMPINNRDPEYYLYQILKTAVNLNDWNEKAMVEVIKRQLYDEKYNNQLDPAIHRVNKVLTNAFCLLGNACEYGADLNGNEDVEKFKIARVMFKVDCEDSANDCYINANSLIDNRPQYNDLTIAAFDWMQLYAVGMITTSASTKSLSRDTNIETQIGENDYVNHICSVMIPRVVLSTWSRSIRGGPFTPQDCGGRQNTKVKPFEYKLKVLYLEGTNWCFGGLQPYCSYVDPLHKDECISEWTEVARKYKTLETKYPCVSELSYYIYQPHLKGNNAYDIPDDRLVSNFHKYPCSIWLNVFTRYPERFANKGLGIPADFHLCDSTNPGTYGVSTRKFIDGSHDIYLSPNVEFRPQDMELVYNTLSYEYPIETLPGDESKSGNNPNTSKLQKLKEKYRPPQKFNSYRGLRPPFVQYMVNRIEKITVQIYECLETILKRGDAIGFDYFVHRIADGRLYIIELRLFVN